MAEPDADAERRFEVDTTVLGEVLEAVGAAEVDGFVTGIAAEMERLISRLEDWIGTDSMSAVGRDAHHLSGGCLAIGLVGIGAVCMRIEADVREGHAERFQAYSLELAQHRQALGDWWSTASTDPRLSAFWPR